MHTIEIWAQLLLCENDNSRIRDFFVSMFGIKPRHVVRNIHITVYHAHRPMDGVLPVYEPANVSVAVSETRFMVMAPGGENPRLGLEPGKRKVGIRVHRQSNAFATILSFRDKLLKYETQIVLGKRKPSTHRTNAFGARYFQPHMTILRPGSGIADDLTSIGIPFRETIGNLTFDRFTIEVVKRSSDV